MGDVLVLEDDACFAPTFADAWRQVVRSLRAVPNPLWERTPLRTAGRDRDVLLLGYFGVKGALPSSIHGRSVRTLQPGGSFFGTHAYLVTRRGAAILRQHTYPVEVQVDAFMLTLQQLGHLRLYLLDGDQVVEQCIGNTEHSVNHSHRPQPVGARALHAASEAGLELPRLPSGKKKAQSGRVSDNTPRRTLCTAILGVGCLHSAVCRGRTAARTMAALSTLGRNGVGPRR